MGNVGRIMQAELDGNSQILYHRTNGEAISTFTFDDAMSFVGETDYALAA